MPEGMFGVETSQFLIAVGGVAAGFLCLILVLWLIRGRGGPSPFLRGGKNRQPRLQVLDAAAVDTRRRLVLVRRDDVEHLIMIGGPTDVVIESSIVDGRSPPYHTMMKTVSEPEQAAIPAKEEPRAVASEERPSGTSAPSPRVAAPVARPEKPIVQAENRDSFAWIGEEPTEIVPATKATAPAASVQPTVRRPETASPPEAPAAPAQSAPAIVATEPKIGEIAPKNEQRVQETPRPIAPPPVVDFPTLEPRASTSAAASPAPMTTAFATATAVAMPEPIIASPPNNQREPTPVFAIESPAKAAEPHFEIDPPRPAAEAPSLDNAVDLLEAARERVFSQPRTEAPAPVIEPAEAAPTPIQRPVAAAVQPPAPSALARQSAPAVAPAKPLGSDFERILEEEMATNLAGGNTAPTVGPAIQNVPAGQLPRRDPGMPRVTGATQEPALQNEIARIFGEMSVTKDDR